MVHLNSYLSTFAGLRTTNNWFFWQYNRFSLFSDAASLARSASLPVFTLLRKLAAQRPNLCSTGVFSNRKVFSRVLSRQFNYLPSRVLTLSTPLPRRDVHTPLYTVSPAALWRRGYLETLKSWPVMGSLRHRTRFAKADVRKPIRPLPFYEKFFRSTEGSASNNFLSGPSRSKLKLLSFYLQSLVTSTNFAVLARWTKFTRSKRSRTRVRPYLFAGFRVIPFAPTSVSPTAHFYSLQSFALKRGRTLKGSNTGIRSQLFRKQPLRAHRSKILCMVPGARGSRSLPLKKGIRRLASPRWSQLRKLKAESPSLRSAARLFLMSKHRGRHFSRTTSSAVHALTVPQKFFRSLSLACTPALPLRRSSTSSPNLPLRMRGSIGTARKPVATRHRFLPSVDSIITQNPLRSEGLSLLPLRPLRTLSGKPAKSLRLSLYALYSNARVRGVVGRVTTCFTSRRFIRAVSNSPSYVKSIRGRKLLRSLTSVFSKSVKGGLFLLPKPLKVPTHRLPVALSLSHYLNSVPSISRAKLRPAVGYRLGFFTCPKLINPSLSRGTALSFLRVTLQPYHSSSFLRSPFFFLTHIRINSSLRNDILSSTKSFSGSSDFLVFPDTNATKVSIFRRLNRQKFLFSARFNALNRLSLFRNTRSQFGSDPKRPGAYLPHLDGGDRVEVAASLASWGKNWILRNVFERELAPGTRTIRIRRIRFKPGYGRIWRAARKSIREILNIHAKYQYRLTPKLQRLYFKVRQQSLPKRYLTLEYSLMASHLSSDMWSTSEMLSNYLVFLNGVSCVNVNTQLFLGDLVQLLVSLKFYIGLRWVRNWSVLRRNRVNKIFYRKNKPATFNKNIRIVRTLPAWFFDLRFTYCAVPKYFELDFFTLSLFVVHDRVALEKGAPTRFLTRPHAILNMYNWKYIT